MVRLRTRDAATQYGSSLRVGGLIETPIDIELPLFASQPRQCAGFDAGKIAAKKNMAGAAQIMEREMIADNGQRCADAHERFPESPERTASSAASIFLISGFFKFCGWKRVPAQRPVEAP